MNPITVGLRGLIVSDIRSKGAHGNTHVLHSLMMIVSASPLSGFHIGLIRDRNTGGF